MASLLFYHKSVDVPEWNISSMAKNPTETVRIYHFVMVLELEPCRFVVEVGAKPVPQVSSSVGLERESMHRENKLV